MNHQHVAARLDQFLDGALCAVERWAVTVHLDECEPCRRHAAAEARLRGRLHEQLAAVEAAPGLTARLQTALAEAPVERARWMPRAFMTNGPVRLAMVLGPAVVSIWLFVLVSMPQAGASLDLPRELVATHALFAQDESFLDVVGGADDVAAWFRETLGLHVAPPDIQGYSLMGARLIVLHGKPVAQLVYETDDEHYLSLMAFRDGGYPEAVSVERQGTISTVTWPVGETRVALIADAPETALINLADGLRGWPDTSDATDQ